MASSTCYWQWVAISAVILFLASPVSAQLGDQLASYTGRNASGYLEPLVNAFGADLNAGLYHSAYIPKGGFHVSLEMLFMSAYFTDEDRTFAATTESGFRPEQTIEAPTVVGSQKAVYVDGNAGTRFAFPGGFNLNSFSFAVPQLRIGSIYGTEALVRFAFWNTGDSYIGEFDLYGVGLRHSVSQYLGANFPIDAAIGAFWQRFSMGDNERGDEIVTAEAVSVGLHMSKRFGMLEPYGGLSYDLFSVDVSYKGDTPEDKIQLGLETDDFIHMTLGFSFNVSFVSAFGQYNIGAQNAFALGLAFQYGASR